ncbi:DUF4037 domain-containing protein [Jiangella rhizosphaerae]|uniref:DUF4037 domain-containing protein n=1 Tax=Jiangella rhizosphaerae TaxID=2293569 RepID=A0A418KV98_9ACTN|nr:DUF4037 domain-containing protein [Jiangella rhizosphaerae]RIQ33652.1 DUF4037 domain-containing protein [Jiangella rhizosphaerae]
MTPAFVPGLDLAEAFYTEVLAPLVGVPHAAALLGEGSEVLGFDTERSTDHEWGPRAQIFVADGDVDAVRARIGAGLPPVFRGLPTAWFSLAAGGVAHHVETTTARAWLTAALGVDRVDTLETADWLALPQQRLLHVTAGRVFRDDLGELTSARAALAWYPDDVWRWMVAVQWHLIGNAEPLRARCREVGDVRGAALLTARLAGLIMELAFLLERRYRPYDKWFGSAFARLDAAAVVGPHVDAALAGVVGSAASDDPIVAALAELGRRHDAAAVSAPVGPAAGDFEVGIGDAVRPYRVSNAGAYVRATLAAVTDPALRALLPVGALDQLTHGDDTLVTFSAWPRRLAGAYRAELAATAAAVP